MHLYYLKSKNNQKKKKNKGHCLKKNDLKGSTRRFYKYYLLEPVNWILNLIGSFLFLFTPFFFLMHPDAYHLNKT